VDLILKIFPNLNQDQKKQFELLENLYWNWNKKINVISRKDLEFLYVKHVLHSLSIAKIVKFKAGSNILDVGTGGGFPGIPLAIFFPTTNFHLIDSIGKKIKVVQAIANELKLKNVTCQNIRAENVNDKYDFIVSRAVTRMPLFFEWVKNNIKSKSIHEIENGILYLKGGNLQDELKSFPKSNIYDLNSYLKDSFFETKKLVHLAI
tara:strand:+ start:98 stop:715 length:618 start_codon:yes stop_codon:yes gene_type:complete